MSKFTIVRSEEEVGILCRLGCHPRFKGVFKARYSDFHVNEIDLNGKIVQLTTLEAPQERKSDIAEDDQQICNLIPEDVRKNIKALQERFENGVSSNLHKSDTLWKETIDIKVTNLDKDERTIIHKWLGNFEKLSSETKEKDGEKYIVVIYLAKNSRFQRRPASRAKYTHCTMYKEGVDTSEAIGLLSKKLQLKPSLITFCGTKDKYGKTAQRICFSNIDANRLVGISRQAKSIYLGNFEYLPHHLRLGDLKGNHFKILLRNVIAESDESINVAVESLKSVGFINYFGLQRFGSYEVSTHTVGKSLLQNQWMEAFDLILKPKANDSNFMKLAKHDWFTNRDPNAAIKHFPHWHRSIESNLLYGLAKYYPKNDFIGAFLKLPRNTRHLYIHSFQSFLWNKVASFRITEMGIKPIVGDLVYMDKEQDDFTLDEIDELDDESSSSGQQLISPSSSRYSVKTLTAEDLSNYTIYDVLIPVQGSLIRIPESPIKDFYDKILKEQGLDADCFLKFKPTADQPKGAYRKLAVRPQNVSHKIITYCDSDPVDTFIPSELDRLYAQKRKERNASNGDSYNSQSQTKEDVPESEKNKNLKSATEKQNDLEKDKKCVIVEFSLPASSYATMALRELMLSDTECSAVAARENTNDEPGVKSQESEERLETKDSQIDEPEVKRRREEK